MRPLAKGRGCQRMACKSLVAQRAGGPSSGSRRRVDVGHLNLFSSIFVFLISNAYSCIGGWVIE